jgi:hypothetical protein
MRYCTVSFSPAFRQTFSSADRFAHVHHGDPVFREDPPDHVSVDAKYLGRTALVTARLQERLDDIVAAEFLLRLMQIFHIAPFLRE